MKKTRIGRSLKKQMPAEAFESIVGKKTLLASDNAFIRESYTLENGFYTLNDGLKKKDMARLKRISDDMSSSGGIFRKERIILLLAVIALITVFNIVFKDRILEKGAETALEMVFRTKAEISGLRVSFTRARFDFKSLSVGDPEEEFKNLFETGPVSGDMDLSRLLRRKVAIETFHISDLSFGTARETSGHLEKKKKVPQKPADEKKKSGGIDINALMDRLKPDLDSPATAKRQAEAIAELSDAWQAENTAFKERHSELMASYGQIEKIDPSKIGSVADAKKALDTVMAFKAALKDSKDSLKDAASRMESDKAKISSFKGELETAVSRDLELISSYTGKAGPGNMLTHIATALLSKRYGKIVGLVSSLRRRMPSGDTKKAKKSPPPPLPRRKGVDMMFPVAAYPAFLIKDMDISYVSAENDDYKKGRCANLSSHPKVWGKPLEVTYKSVDGGKTTDAYLYYSPVDSKMRGRFAVGGERIRDMRLDGVEMADSVSMAYSLDLNISGEGGNVRGEGRIRINEIDIAMRDEKDAASSLIKNTVRDMGPVTGTFGYSVTPDGGLSLTVGIKADELLNKAFAAALGTAADSYGADARKILMKELSPYQSVLDSRLDILSGSEGALSALTLEQTGMDGTVDKLIAGLKKKAAAAVLGF